MSIIGDPLEPYVNKQIEIRQKKMGIQSGRDLEMLSWANSKTAWVKLASGVSLSGSFAEDRLKEIFPSSDIPKYMGEELAKKYILFGGTSNLENEVLKPRTLFKNTYDHTDTDFGLVPMPGIESIQVNDKNRGSIKEATVEIVAYSRKQLEILDILYLRLGYVVLLEWGNSHYINNRGEYVQMGNTLCEKKDGFFNISTPQLQNIDKQIKGLRNNYSGNYDGFIAKVVNFNWTFQPDGSYKITLKLISYGDVVESFKMNLSPPESQNTPKIKNKIDNFLNSFLSLSINPNEKISPKIPFNLEGKVHGNFLNVGESIIEEYKLKSSYFSKLLNYFPIGDFWEDNEIEDFQTQKEELRNKWGYLLNNPDIKWYYIEGVSTESLSIDFILNGSSSSQGLRNPQIFNDTSEDLKRLRNSNSSWYAGEDYFMAFYIPEQKVTNLLESSKSVFKMNYKTEEDEDNSPHYPEYYIQFFELLEYINSFFPVLNGEDGEKMLSIKTSRLYCKHMPNQISFDPRVCLIRNDDVIYSPNQKYSIFNKLLNFVTSFSNNPEYKIGKVENIYLNFETIVDSLNSNLDEKGDISPIKFLEDICVKLNKALGGINNLEPIVNEQKIIEIVDTSLPSQRINKPQTPIQVYGYNGKIKSESESTFVRNINLKTEISPEFASMVTIGSTAAGYSKGMEATAFSKWNKGVIDRFKVTITSPPEELEGETLSYEEEIERSYNNYIKPDLINYEDLGYSGNADFPSSLYMDSELIDKNLSIVTEFFKYLRAKTYQENSNEYTSTSNGFIPFNMSLTLDGISGIKIYNKIEVDTRFLPYNYPESLKFIVKRVSHKLSNGDWETTIETTVMPGAYSFAGN